MGLLVRDSSPGSDDARDPHAAGREVCTQSLSVLLSLAVVILTTPSLAQNEQDPGFENFLATELQQPNAVLADANSMQDDNLEDLRWRVERLEQENRDLRSSMIHGEAGHTLPQPESSYFSLLHDRIAKLELKTADKMPLIKLGGFMQVDNAFYTQDSDSQTTYGDMQDGTGFRRARLQAYGSLTEHTNYIIEMDFATAGRPSFMDLWGEQTNLGWLGTVRIGQFRQPTTMDCWTSIRHMEFLERSNPFQAMDPFRRVGIMSYNSTEDHRIQWASSIYRTGFTLDGVNGTLGDTRYGTFIGDNGGWSTAFRGTTLLFLNECDECLDLFHVGGGFNYSRIGGNGLAASPVDGGFYEARSIPGVFVGDPLVPGKTVSSTPFITNTGIIPATDFTFWHLELAGQYGPAHFQTELLMTNLGTTDFGHQILSGYYAQCGVFLTGEQCGYNKNMGVLDYNTRPLNDRWGAWEIAYRFDYTDLPNVGQTPAPPPANAGTSGINPNPGQVAMNTVALNWWWNDKTRVQFNYINAVNDSLFAVYGTSHTHIFATRFQIEF